jgi:hypothetical protein
MTVPTHTDALFLGLKLYEWLTLVGIFIGPVVAVLITLFTQTSSQARERKLTVIRHLLATRRLPGDAGWNAAINLIPVEFNKSETVMNAWSAYMDSVRYKPAPENKGASQQQVSAAQTKLIFEAMKAAGLKLSETDIQTEGYLSDGLVGRDTLYLDSLKAMRDIATAMTEQVNMLKTGMAKQDGKPN